MKQAIAYPADFFWTPEEETEFKRIMEERKVPRIRAIQIYRLKITGVRR